MRFLENADLGANSAFGNKRTACFEMNCSKRD